MCGNRPGSMERLLGSEGTGWKVCGSLWKVCGQVEMCARCEGSCVRACFRVRGRGFYACGSMRAG